jgi:serine/threonine protein kinase
LVFFLEFSSIPLAEDANAVLYQNQHLDTDRLAGRPPLKYHQARTNLQMAGLSPAITWEDPTGAEPRPAGDQQREIRYRKVRILGSGNFGVVWEAINLDGRERFALKLIKWPHSSSDGTSPDHTLPDHSSSGFLSMGTFWALFSSDRFSLGLPTSGLSTSGQPTLVHSSWADTKMQREVEISARLTHVSITLRYSLQFR